MPVDQKEAICLFGHFSGKHVLVALSGGPDSIALMGLLAETAAQLGIVVSAATVDHGLRVESAEESAMAAHFCLERGITHRRLVWADQKPVTGIQAAARAARYALLAECARKTGADGLALAHTMDDQAETVLLRLIAGSGVSGLKAMLPETMRNGVPLWRPLLDISKTRLLATCKSRNWSYADDPSNRNPAFGRVRIRKILATLQDEGLTMDRLALLARRAQRSEEALESMTREVEDRALQGTHALSAKQVLNAPAEIALRVIARRITAISGFAADEHIRLNRLETLLEDLKNAPESGLPARKTLAGVLITLTLDGLLQFRAEARRKRGRNTDR